MIVRRRHACAVLALLAAMTATTPAFSQGSRVSAFDPSAPPADPALTAHADALVERVWSDLIAHCDGASLYRVDEQLMIELDQPQFKLVAMRLPAAAKEAGYGWRGVALASARRWRWARTGTGRITWSDWEAGETKIVRDDNLTLDRGFTAVTDVVLKFDIVHKDGEWSATAPISQVSYAVRPLDLQAVGTSDAPATCGN